MDIVSLLAIIGCVLGTLATVWVFVSDKDIDANSNYVTRPELDPDNYPKY